MYNLYVKVKDEDQRIYEMLVRLQAQLTLNNKVNEDISEYELPYVIGILENRLGIREWHGVE